MRYTREQLKKLRKLADQGVDVKSAVDKLLAEHSQPAADAPHQGAERKRIVVPTNGEIFTLTLDRSKENPISGLVEASGLWGYANPNINDQQFPIELGGVVEVKYRIIPGYELKPYGNGRVWREKTERLFKTEEGVKFAEADEGLLPFVEDLQLGLRRPVVVFVKGSGSAFIVGRVGRDRVLNLYSGEYWNSNYDFLGVCE